jgi:hypothetical protein
MPTYETDQDRAFEEFFRVKLLPAYDFVKMPASYGFDFWSKTDNTIAELKCRRNYMLQELPDKQLILAWQKHRTMTTYSNTYNLEAKLYVAAKDGLWEIDIHSNEQKDGHPLLTFSGRYDRNGVSDVEPCVRYDVTKFTQCYTYPQLVQLRKEHDREVSTSTKAPN